MHDDHVLMGDMYDFLACEGNTIFGQYFPDLFGHPPLYEDAYPTVNLLCPTPGYAGHASSSSSSSSSDTTYVPILSPSQNLSNILSRQERPSLTHAYLATTPSSLTQPRASPIIPRTVTHPETEL